jgi:hypothetical protein
MGREIKVSGDRTVPDWNISVINDEDFGLRDIFEQWSMIQNSMVGNLRRDRNYKADGVITQYGKEGKRPQAVPDGRRIPNCSR